MSTETPTRASRRQAPRLRTTLQHNHLLRSSILLTAASAVTALTGFVFWAIVARTYSATEVGMASSLITAVSLISYLSLFGLNSVLVRFFAQSSHRNVLATRAVLGVAAASLVIGSVAYAIVVHRSGELTSMTTHPWFAMIFVLSCLVSSINLITDSLFISARQTQYNVIADGLVQGLVKLMLPLVFVGLGAVGIFASTTVAALAAAVVSMIAAWRVLGVRPALQVAGGAGKLISLRYGIGTYASSVFYLLPILLVPLVVLGRLGAAAAGIYYIGYQISNLLNAIATAVGESLFAEGSYAGADFVRLLRRSALLLAAAVLPAAALLAICAEPVMHIFGPTYAIEGSVLLRLLALNAILVSVITWGSFALKVAGRLRPLLVINVGYCVAVLVLIILLAPHGLAGVGQAWVAAGFLGALAVLLTVVRIAPRPALDLTASDTPVLVLPSTTRRSP